MGFDLEFASGQGFADLSEHDAAPTLQLAVIYTAVVRATAAGRAAGDAGGARAAGTAGNAGDAGGAGAAEEWVVVRRLRLHTIQLPVARSARAMLEAAQPEPLMVLLLPANPNLHLYPNPDSNPNPNQVLLVHKVMRGAEEQGFREGRLLLQDWMVVLLAKHALATRPRHGKHVPSADPEALCASLRAVPRWVFALLRGPLLSSHTPLSPHRVSVDGARPLLTTAQVHGPHLLLGEPLLTMAQGASRCSLSTPRCRHAASSPPSTRASTRTLRPTSGRRRRSDSAGPRYVVSST